MGTPVPVVDSDTHLYEPRELWAEHAGRRDRDLALRIEEDELGHAWLVHRGRRIYPAEVFHPGRVEETGAGRERRRLGLPAEARYDELLPDDYWDPVARVAYLDRIGVDESVCFPNFGLLWEQVLGDDLAALECNMAAWNRWAIVVAREGGGRLHPVAHVTLRDPAWLEAQLSELAAGGVRLAMMGPALVDGRALSHPDLDRAWSLFVDHGVTPVFHVSNFPHPFDAAWFADDFDAVDPVLRASFLWVPAALALADLAVHGVLARHPDLRVGVMELSAGWVTHFLPNLDGGFAFHARQNGRPLRELELAPSDYLRRQVRVAAFSYERPDVLAERAGDLFMFCSDYPHGEGTATPLADYRSACHRSGEPAAAPGLFGGNVSWLLRRDRV